MSDTTRLRITEIFFSLQGESRSVGIPTVFVRLTGCPLRCNYCDTSYAFSGGEWKTLPEIMSAVAEHEAKYVTVTGGEPLAQKGCAELLVALCDAGYQVSLETSGALDVSKIDQRVSKVMDFKTPGSGEVERNLYENLESMTLHDQLKFVITGRDDYEWASALLSRHSIPEKTEVLFSPVVPDQAPGELANWILEDKLPVRFQIQLHKILWGDEPGR